ncbi:hypothetical protein L486_08360 [Kwoniella mangroviensis CBS 10435]|uniref:Trafficking protein particle complex subunit 11 domain-containing protein n=1 Tax=Kwoniella mangroviensis CBS 10435 TaxID=1331196 RepID=A0A1B9IF38_9TREE|nr:hypothetical protein L486_08360 [Kwoniella mangroviensis CBS 10435]
MNSYPHEFLAHPQPLMFVAGLNPVSRERSVSSASTTSISNRRQSGGASSLLEPTTAGNIALTTPITSPTPRNDNLPSPLDELTTSEETTTQDGSKEVVEGLDERDKEFEALVYNLRGALTPMGGKGKVWLGQEGRKDFRIVLVDKGVRLPMRKINPSSSSTSQSQASIADLPTSPHSPLSPLIPSSPLYPDGLIAPVWVRKHAELVPSVFVLFLRLYESKPIPSSDDPEVNAAKEAANKAMEKDQDDQLIREIGDRRRRLGERGIKLTVVLMASAATLADSPALDPRLSYLRRASALSAKASLFVLTPVPADQLPDFVQSLQDALYDSAMEYYSNHAKRVRRKRSRVPVSQNILSPSTAQGHGQGPRALGPQGWAVRYDWKAGWFAEVRGDFETARRHYEDCWNELAKMFSSTTTLPPRTKRWAEAKVLADCVAICKLLLYDDQGPRVLNPFFVHLKRFGDLSRGWGIGEETFEFWSWIARQYRIFAELLEMAQQSGMRIASLAPPTFPTAVAAAAPPPPDYYTTPISSGNPLQVLQQPAFYYYTAATCSIQRQLRYQEALAAENDALSSEAGSTSGYVSTAPGFAIEKKVDHAALVIELFTKAYSLLKEQDHAQNRLALFVAFRIAEVYCQSAQYDLALRFFDRISQGFKRERWSPIVRQIRKLWYECAQQTGNVESAARLLVEMMSPDSGVEGEERAALQEDLLSLMKTTSPSSTEPIAVNLEGQNSLLDVVNVQAGFWQSESTLSQSVPYQVILRCPGEVAIDEIQFSSLIISWSDNRHDTVINASEGSQEQIEFVKVEQNEGNKASLKWGEEKTLVINGETIGDVEGEVRISGLKLCLKQGSWDLQIHLSPDDLEEWITPKGAIVPVQALSSSVDFIHKSHDLDVDLTHVPSAFVGEDVEINIKVTNQDDREMDISLSIFLQPGDGDEDVGSTLTMDDQVSPTFIKDIPLGKLSPSASTSKTIFLRASMEGTKIVDFSLQSTVKLPASKTLSPTSDDQVVERTEEITRTAVIPVLRPFEVKMAVRYSQRLAGTVGAGVGGGANAIVGILVEVPGPRAVRVEKIELLDNDNNNESGEKDVKLVSSSLLIDCDVHSDWDQNTSYALSAKFSLSFGLRGGTAGDPIKVPANLVFTWKSDSSKSSITTVHPIPPLFIESPRESYLISTLHLPLPPTAKIHEPFDIHLNVLNTHPTSSATNVNIVGETKENFVWLGNRNIITSPPLKPGEARTMKFTLIPLSLSSSSDGWMEIPKISVFEGEGEDREEVSVKDGNAILVRP